MKKLTKIMILVLAASMLVALLIPMVGSAAASDPLAAGKAYTMGDYLKDYLSSPIWKKDAVGMADREETKSLGQVLRTTGENFTINHEFQTGDIVRLNTRAGEKSLTLIRDGIESNILNNMQMGSKWFNLRVGDNIFSYTALHGAENLRMTIELQPIFTGV